MNSEHSNDNDHDDSDDTDSSNDSNDSEVIQLPIDGTLDLHTFRPGDIKELIPEYLAECRNQGILQVRIIHGKGTGTLRRTVQAILARLPEVISYRLAGEDAGGWGATLVTLAPLGVSNE